MSFSTLYQNPQQLLQHFHSPLSPISSLYHNLQKVCKGTHEVLTTSWDLYTPLLSLLVTSNYLTTSLFSTFTKFSKPFKIAKNVIFDTCPGPFNLLPSSCLPLPPNLLFTHIPQTLHPPPSRDSVTLAGRMQGFSTAAYGWPPWRCFRVFHPGFH